MDDGSQLMQSTIGARSNQAQLGQPGCLPGLLGTTQHRARPSQAHRLAEGPSGVNEIKISIFNFFLFCYFQSCLGLATLEMFTFCVFCLLRNLRAVQVIY